MLKKLFVYHFKAIFRQSKWPFLALPITAATTFIILMLGMLIPEASGAFEAVNYGLTAIAILAVGAYAVLLVYSFVEAPLHHYRSFFGNDAAWIRMLPASGKTQHAATLLAGAVWGLILIGITLFSAVFGVLLPAELTMQVDGASMLSPLLRSVEDSVTLLSPLAIALFLFEFLLLAYAGVTVGASLLHRRRALGVTLALVLFLGGAFLIHQGGAILISPIAERGEILADVVSVLLSILLCAVAHVTLCVVFRRMLRK